MRQCAYLSSGGFIWRLVFCAICLGAATGGLASEDGRGKGVLLVAPARMRVLQLAFDLDWLRSISLVSYRGDAKSEQPLLHLWADSDWRHVGMSNFAGGRFLGSAPDTVVLIGDDEMLPAVIEESIPWSCPVLRIETIEVAELINRLDLIFEFKEDEWKWLSRRYNLVLTDIYEDRRTINPYETRRSQLPVEIPEEFGDGVAPAVLMEERKVEGVVLIEEIIVDP